MLTDTPTTVSVTIDAAALEAAGQLRILGTDDRSMDPRTTDQLKSIVERIERLEEEKKAIGEDIREVYVEAKGNGFDPKIIRKVVALRRQETKERIEQEQLVDLYLMAIGSKD
jgi:uncharacterized protein (UPF0335 family)